MDLWYRPTTAGIFWVHRPPMILPDVFQCEAPRAICRTVSRTNKRPNHICFWPQIPISCDPIRPVRLMTPRGAFNHISRSYKAPAFLLMLLLRVGGISEFILRETIPWFSLSLNLMFCWGRLDFCYPRDSNDIKWVPYFLFKFSFFFRHSQSI